MSRKRRQGTFEAKAHLAARVDDTPWHRDDLRHPRFVEPPPLDRTWLRGVRADSDDALALAREMYPELYGPIVTRLPTKETTP